MPRFDELRAEAALLCSTLHAQSARPKSDDLKNLRDLINLMQDEHDKEIERMTDEHEEQLVNQQAAHTSEKDGAVAAAKAKVREETKKDCEDEIKELRKEQRTVLDENSLLKNQVSSLERQLDRRRFVNTIDGQRIIERAYRADPVQTAIELNYLHLGHMAGQLGVQKGMSDGLIDRKQAQVEMFAGAT